MPPNLDALVVGSGPNGLSAGIRLALAGLRVRVIEANETPGGGCRSAELTLPGFTHDLCSAIHPMGAASPFFRRLPLSEHGLEWIRPEILMGHPFEGGQAALLHRSLKATATELGDGDGETYRRLLGPFVAHPDGFASSILATRLRGPAHPLLMAQFGARAAWPASLLARRSFRGEAARALFGGISAHSTLRLDQPLSASFGLVLASLGHAYGWPVARGGSQALTEALLSHLRSLGGEIECGRRVRTLADLPAARVTLFDITPRQLLAITGNRFHGVYRRQLERFRYGPGAFKGDYALSGPVPWRCEAVRQAGTVHVGGSLDEIARAEDEVARGIVPGRPFVIAAQQSSLDPTRAPAGKHTFWAYCHVPSGCDVDMTERIEQQIERFAPGFRDLVLARHVTSPAGLEAENANYVGGDISGGSPGGLQLFFRPAVRLDPYSTPDPKLFLCSASTPPGPGVHGMCGYLAARSALRRVVGVER